MLPLHLSLSLLAACNDGVGVVPPATVASITVPTTVPPPEPTVPIVTETGADTGDTGGATGSTGDTGVVLPDPCLTLASAPLSATLLTGYPSTEEFHFDAFGNLWNATDAEDAVFVTTFGGPITVFTPYDSAETAGTRVLPDGSALAVANEWNGSIDRIDLTTGAVTPLLGGLDSPNSVGFDDKGYLYVAVFGGVVRWPLTGGPVEVIVDLPNYDFDGITFAADYSRVYFNQDDGGTVGYADLAADGAVLGIGTLAQLGADLDGATADSCGNVYVTDTSGTLWRVDPYGVAIRYYEAPGSVWTTSVNFGSGVGGWERDHLYVMERYLGLIDLDVGVDGYPEPHYP
jgi:hypothetical protein